MKVKALKIAVAFLSTILGQVAFAWGPVGHEVVASVGSELALTKGQSFWGANDKGMRLLTNVPDRVWKKPETKPTEAPTHWFQIDTFVPSLNPLDILKFPKIFAAAVSQYTQPVIETNGFSPWRIVQFYNDAVNALKAKDYNKALEAAGVMSHYIGDIAQPLHLTSNHDGQMTGNVGIHMFFETKNLGPEVNLRPVVIKRASELLKNPAFKAQLKGDLMEVVLKEVARSVAQRDLILENDTRLGRNSDEGKAAQLQLAIERMADGAATLSEILNRIWLDSGMNPSSTVIVATDPAWIPLDFSGPIPQLSASRAIHFVR